MKKTVVLDLLALKELSVFPNKVGARFYDLFEILGKEGKLEMPFAKKIGTKMFEVRVKSKGQYRAIYAYVLSSQIIILSAFLKKTQKTPKKELAKALKRLRNY